MMHIKLFGRNEVAQMTDEYLIIMSQEMDNNGEWVPNRVQTAQTFPQLKEVLREAIAAPGVVVVRGSRQFERLAFELGLRHLNSEWGKPIADW